MEVIRGVIAAESRILKDPEPMLAVTNLGDSSVDILCRTYTAPADWYETKLAMLKAVKQALDANGISIPYPQRDVHLYQQTTGS